MTAFVLRAERNEKGRPRAAPTGNYYALRLRGCWGWRRGGGWRGAEIDFGGLAGAGVGFEVGVVAGKAAHAGNEAVGEESDEGVVVLDGFVVAAAFDGDTVFGAGEFVLDAEEI